jgi:predicted ATPase
MARPTGGRPRPSIESTLAPADSRRNDSAVTFVDPRRLLNHRRYDALQQGEEQAPSRPARRTRRIVLTGGPGSGKSTAAAFLAREFVDDLWVLPESATLLYKGGLPRASSDLGQQVSQRAIYTVQRSLEEATLLQHPDRVQLCDRATIDGAAYWPDGSDDFFRALGTSRAAELARYDAVVFMHTAAMMPAGYERDMDVRNEDTDEAIELDRRTHALYADHPVFIEIESSASFLDKLTRVRNAIDALLHPPALVPPPRRGEADRSFPRPLHGIVGGGEGVHPAPVSALMGLASVQHVLPHVD